MRTRETVAMIPLSDGIPARRFPFVNVGLIAACLMVWIFYELPHLNSAVFHAAFYPCTVNHSCHGPERWELSWFTAMFLHGSAGAEHRHQRVGVSACDQGDQRLGHRVGGFLFGVLAATRLAAGSKAEAGEGDPVAAGVAP